MSSQLSIRFDAASDTFSTEGPITRTQRSTSHPMKEDRVAVIPRPSSLAAKGVGDVLGTKSITLCASSPSLAALTKARPSAAAAPAAPVTEEVDLEDLELMSKHADTVVDDYLSIKGPVAYDLELLNTRLFTTNERLKAVPSDYHFCTHTRPRVLETDVRMEVIPEDGVIFKVLQSKIQKKFSDKFVQKNLIREAEDRVAFRNEKAYHSELWSFVLGQAKDKEAYRDLYQRWKLHMNGYQTAGRKIGLNAFERKFWELIENKPFHAIMKRFQREFIDSEMSASVEELNSMLIDYKKHVFARFPLFLRAHHCFLEGYRVLNLCLAGDRPLQEAMHGWALRSIESTVKDAISASVKGKTSAKPLYRLVQGSHDKIAVDTHRCQALTERSVKRLIPLCGASKADKKLGMERAHTMPFPGVFSWTASPKETVEKDCLLISRPKESTISKEILELNGAALKEALSIEIQSILKRHGGIPNPRFVMDALHSISTLSLVKASETHHLFGMFNGYDHCSESEIVTSVPGGYKGLIAQGLKASMEYVAKRETSESISLEDVARLQRPYLQATFASTKEKMQTLSRQLLFGTNLKDLKENGLNRINLSCNQLLKFFSLANTHAAVSPYVSRA